MQVINWQDTWLDAWVIHAARTHAHTHAHTHARTHTHMHTHTHTIRVFTTIPVNIYHSCDISVCYVTAHLNHLTLVLTHPYGGYTCVRYVSLWLSISFLAKAGICSQLSNRHFISEELWGISHSRTVFQSLNHSVSVRRDHYCGHWSIAGM